MRSPPLQSKSKIGKSDQNHVLYNLKTNQMKTTILKISLVFLFFCLLGAGCDKNKDDISVCGVESPLVNLDWLRDIVNELEQNAEVKAAKILIYRWNDEDYIYVQKTLGSAQDIPSTIFDCDGNEKFKCGGNQPVSNCSTFFRESKRYKIIWEK